MSDDGKLRDSMGMIFQCVMSDQGIPVMVFEWDEQSEPYMPPPPRACFDIEIALFNRLAEKLKALEKAETRIQELEEDIQRYMAALQKARGKEKDARDLLGVETVLRLEVQSCIKAAAEAIRQTGDFRGDGTWEISSEMRRILNILTADEPIDVLEARLADCDPDVCAKVSGTKKLAGMFLKLIPFAHHDETCDFAIDRGACTCGLTTLMMNTDIEPTPTTVIELLDWALKVHGFDGLCAEDGDCGCQVGALVPNDECPYPDCQPARKGPCDSQGRPCDGGSSWRMFPATAPSSVGAPHAAPAPSSPAKETP